VEAAAIHAGVAPTLLRRDPRDIDRLWADLYRTFDYQVTGGAEMRALSAVDLALWDLLGKSLKTPVYRLLGGRSNPRVRLYNTCFGYKYDFNKEPEKIMQELIDTRGIRAIKIWPFDGAASRNRDQYITQQDIDQALAPVRKLRDTFGNQIDILMEFHSHWDLASAVRIARSLEPYQPMWLEDMLLPGNFQQYRQLAEATPLPLTISERMAGRMQFAQLLEARAAKYIMFDVCWCGGVSEARKIATMAEAYQLPVAPHTAGGPLLFYATTHLTTACTNVAIQESCQVFYERDWKEFLVDPISPKEGFISAPESPGFGMEVKPEIWQHPAAVTQTTKA
jgi:L-alanine-DL-glutamate epimerase-like enolase superfamily enzyme